MYHVIKSEIKNHNSKSGNDAISWEYEEVFDSLHRNDANIVPVKALSSIKSTVPKLGFGKPTTMDQEKIFNEEMNLDMKDPTAKTPTKRFLEHSENNEPNSKRIRVQKSKNQQVGKIVDTIKTCTDTIQKTFLESTERLNQSLTSVFKDLTDVIKSTQNNK